MNLNRHGSACRCLLRLRENQGNPVISDEDFLATHIETYPGWVERPGAVDLPMILALAQVLGVASGGERVQTYPRLRQLYREGHAILIKTRSEQRSEKPSEDHYSLLVELDEDKLSVWQPMSDGYAQMGIFPSGDDWSGAHSEAIVLYSSAEAKEAQ